MSVLVTIVVGVVVAVVVVVCVVVDGVVVGCGGAKGRAVKGMRGDATFSHALTFRSRPMADGKVGIARRKVGKADLRETRL